MFCLFHLQQEHQYLSWFWPKQSLFLHSGWYVGFRMRMLITRWCFSCFWAVNNFLASHTALPVRRLGCTRRWKGTEAGQLTQIGQREVPSYSILFMLNKKLGELSEGAAPHQGLAEHLVSGWWAIAFASFVLCFFVVVIIFPSINLSLCRVLSSSIFSHVLSRPIAGQWANWCVGLSSLLD